MEEFDEKLKPHETELSESSTVKLHVSTAGSDVLGEGSIIAERYKVLSTLGSGAIGVVYRVKQIFLNKDMALKTLNKYQDNETTARRFHQEAKAASALDHPALIKVHDFGQLEDNRPFLVMELVTGLTLAEHLKTMGRLSLEDAIPLFANMCEGLAHAHENGVVHRDIKPSNIMLVPNKDGSKTAKIVDFGIAKLIHNEGGEIQALTRTGEIFGSPLYMSPEQCHGQRVDKQSDIYSLGCALFEALTGCPPFMGETALQTMMKHTSEPAITLKEASLGVHFPEDIERIVARMLAKSPEDRYQDARAVADDLRQIHSDAKTVNESVNDQIKHKSNLVIVAVFSTLGLAILVAFTFGQYGFLPQKSQQQKAEQITSKPPPAADQQYSVLTFLPLSNVFERSDGKAMRRFHIPRNLGKISVVNDNNRRPEMITHESFELPASQRIQVEVDPATRVANSDVFSGFDADAIESLSIKDNEINEAALFGIARLKSLRVLNIEGTNTSDRAMSDVSKLPNLVNLKVEGTNVTTAGLIKLSNLERLEVLSVSDLKDGVRLLEALKANKALTYLSVKHCGLRDPDLRFIANHSKLRHLILEGNKDITDRGVEELLPLKELTVLDVNSCSVSPAAASKYSKKFFKLRSFKL